jgi:transposase
MAAESVRVEVRDKRVFSEDEKRRIVAEYRAAVADKTGGGAVLRREGIYQSLVWHWGNQIDDDTLGKRRRGPAPSGKDPAKVRVKELERQLHRARVQIDTLEELVTAQGKCLALHGDLRIDVNAISRNS